MHGREGGDFRKHMLSLPSVVSSNCSSLLYFFKDGRKISVGDCALFKRPQDAPPFIGTIRRLISIEESSLTLSVNWFYRPAEVKLGKGVAIEAAPNEVFYSFHSDEIPAASLLHPCKVAFLPKGVELPPGVSSFVCRRVYDITHKCLWWLTDQDFIDDRQKEVDQLLRRTHAEMHASTQRQQATRSPIPVNCSAATSPSKRSPDSVQNSSSNLSSHTKGKKRERGDQLSENIKRERSARADNGDYGQLRSEITKIAEKGLVDSETVEKLVQLMQPERKADLTCRSMLAGIIAASDKVDCLSQFVQLQGIPLLNNWLQEVHKGKISDHGSPRDGDKYVEDFLLVLLRALDKLPVNLNALQICNIGKSVNLLRTHKNIKIQKKARSLVDTWKKRVEAELNINDAKSGSSQVVTWSGRSQHGSPHGGNRHSSGSSEAAIRSSVVHHSSLKSTSVRLLQGDSTSKSASACPVGSRSVLSHVSNTANFKDEQSRLYANGASSEPAQAAMREEKSSSSSHSHTNSQCSSDLAKNIGPFVKEDARSSTAGSKCLSKMIVSGSKNRNSASDLQGTTCSAPKETVINRGSTMARISGVDKVSDNVNAVDASVNDANSHKLIVKIPNRARGAAQSLAGGAVEDSGRNSRASSPGLLEKQVKFDTCLRGKHDPCPSSGVDGLSTSVSLRKHNENRKLSNVSKVVSSSSRNEVKHKNGLDSSFSSMNALVESCVKVSEANTSMSTGDDGGMNLLASVAAGEISISATVSPSVSPHRDSASAEDAVSNYNGSKKQLYGEGFIQQSPSDSTADVDESNFIVGMTSSHPSTSSKTLHRNEEGCLKSNSGMGKSVADGASDILNGNSASVKEGSVNQLPVVSQGLGGSLVSNGKVEDTPSVEESEKRIHGDNVFYSSSTLDEKNNVGQGLRSNITLEPNSVSVALQSESVNEIGKITVISLSCTDQELPAENLNEVMIRKTDGLNLCDNLGLDGNRRVVRENALSPIPQKQDESSMDSKEQATSCKSENMEKEEARVLLLSSSTKQENCAKTVQQEPEVHPSTKGSEIVVTEEEGKEVPAAATGIAAVSPSTGGAVTDPKLGFDLNEGFGMDEGKNDEPVLSGVGPYPSTVCSHGPLQLPVSSAPGGFPVSITVTAASKGSFVPPDDLLSIKTELGWKGSAATSAFRPAEPRKFVEIPPGQSESCYPCAPACKQARPPLHIDLNVADERILLDVGCHNSGQESCHRETPLCELMTPASLRCSRGFDLDLNKVDEAADVGQHSTSCDQRLEASTLPIQASSSGIFSNGQVSGSRDFDLNNGLATEELPIEKMLRNQHGFGNIPRHTPFGPRISSSEVGNSFAWYTPRTSYSPSTAPSTVPERETFPIVGTGNGTQRVIGGPTSNLSFNADAYKGTILPAAPTIPFHSTPFQYPLFPFGTSFPLPTPALSGGSSGFMDPTAGGRISAIPSQLVGTAAAVPFQYPHPYMFSRPILDVDSNGGAESNQKRRKQGLDLNSGTRGAIAEGRDESVPIVSRQLSAMTSQSFAEEQGRMYSIAGGVLKSNELEGGWSMDKLNFKQSSWR